MEKTIGVYDAKTQLSRLIEAVEHGEAYVISRNGRPVARLIAYEDDHREKALAAADRIRGLWKTNTPVSDDEIIDAAHEGHRY